MSKETLAVKITSGDKAGATASFEYDLPDNLQEAIDKLGHEVVEAFAIRAIVVAVQGHARGLLGAGKTDSEIQTAMDDWTPGMPRVAKSGEQKFEELWDKLTPEDRAAIQAKLGTGKAKKVA